MKDGLPRVASIVDHHPVTALIEAEFFGQRLCDEEQMSDELPISVVNAMDVPDMFFRNDKDMGGRLRVDVCERNYMLVVVYKFRGNLFLDDLTEETVRIVSHFISPPRPA